MGNSPRKAAAIKQLLAEEDCPPTSCSASSSTPETDHYLARISATRATWKTCDQWAQAGQLMTHHARRMERERNTAMRELFEWARVSGYLLGCLKSHHMTKRGISTLVKKAEAMIPQDAELTHPETKH